MSGTLPDMTETPDVTDGIRDGLAALTVEMDSLTPFEDNPRRGQVAAIAACLAGYGQHKPLVVQSSTRKILAGNHTYLAARHLGWERIAAALVDVDDTDAKRILAFDN